MKDLAFTRKLYCFIVLRNIFVWPGNITLKARYCGLFTAELSEFQLLRVAGGNDL